MFRRTGIIPTMMSKSKLEWIGKLHYGWKDAPSIGHPIAQVSSPTMASIQASYGKGSPESLRAMSSDGTFDVGTPSQARPTSSSASQSRPRPRSSEMSPSTAYSYQYASSRTFAQAGGDSLELQQQHWDERRTAEHISALGIPGAAYAMALLFACSGSRTSRDWIAGFVALFTSSSEMVEIAMQYDASMKDVLELDKIIEAKVPEDEEARNEIKRCFVYDACRAAVFDENYSAANHERLAAVSKVMGVGFECFKEIEDIVVSEREVMDLKTMLLQQDSPVNEKRIR